MDKNIQDGLSAVRYNFLHTFALKKATDAEATALKKANKAEEKAKANAENAEKAAVNATNRKIAAKQNIASSRIPNNQRSKKL